MCPAIIFNPGARLISRGPCLHEPAQVARRYPSRKQHEGPVGAGCISAPELLSLAVDARVPACQSENWVDDMWPARAGGSGVEGWVACMDQVACLQAARRQSNRSLARSLAETFRVSRPLFRASLSVPLSFFYRIFLIKKNK